METNLRDTETLDLWPDEDAEERAFLEHLRANGIRLATKSLDRPRVIGKQRPRWLAFMIRTLRRLHLYRD
ncbi:MAG TPA: hypothetical protein VFS20_03335 [Longimicrobium sp.]|nr:hypothetical protein [Longimicrobium sp.]